MRLLLSVVMVACGSTLVASAWSVHEQTALMLPDVLKNSIAFYSTLTSYADTGTVKGENPGIVADSKFTTYFRRATRDLYFDYQGLTSRNPAYARTTDMTRYRRVIWMFKGEMEMYDYYFQNHEIVAAEGGGQVRTMNNAAYTSRGTSILIPSLLYSKSGLPSTILQVEEAEEAGVEQIAGRRCHKIVGIAAAYFPNGRRTGVRPVTIWIDAESRLIRRVFEDTPKGFSSRSYSRLTITIDPRANPAIEDSRFQFTVPSN